MLTQAAQQASNLHAVLVYFPVRQMEILPAVERGLWVALLCAEAVLCLLLWSRSRVRRFPVFFSYLALEVSTGLILIQIPFDSAFYNVAFSWYAAAASILRFGVIAEVFIRVFQEFNGRATGFRDAVVGSSLLIGAGLATLSLLPTKAFLHWGWPQTAALVIRQWQSFGFVIALIGTWAVLRFALDVSRYLSAEVFEHWRILTVFLAVSGLTSMAVLLSGGGLAVHPINTVMLSVDIACCFAWIRCMKSHPPCRRRALLSPQEIERIHLREQDLIATVARLPGEVRDRIKAKR